MDQLGSWATTHLSRIVLVAAFAVLTVGGLSAIWESYRWQRDTTQTALAFEILEDLDRLEWFVDDAVSAANGVVRRRGPNPPAGEPTAQDELRRFRSDEEGAKQVAEMLRRRAVGVPVFRDKVERLQRAVASNAEQLAEAIGAERRQPAIKYSPFEFPDNVDALVEKMRTEERSAFRRGMALQESRDGWARQFVATAVGSGLLLALFATWHFVVTDKRRLRAERALQAREEQYRQVVENAGDIIFRTDAGGRFTYCNQTAQSMLHFTEQELLGRSYLKLIPFAKRREVANFYIRQFAKQRPNTYYEYPVVDGHGRERWLGQNLQLVIEDGKVVGFQAIARDISERKRAEAELARSRTFIERIAATTPGILYVYDLEEQRHIFANREAEAVLGLQPGTAENYFDRCAERFHRDDVPALMQQLQALREASDGEVHRVEYRVRHVDGSWAWLASRDTPFERNADGLVTRIVGIAQDVTERRAVQEKLVYQANFDALTGLANRQHFTEQLDALLGRLTLESGMGTLCLVDIDNFKGVNDRCGHAAGDEVLESLGAIMRTELRASDIAARLGGDEFCFVAAHANGLEGLKIAERIRERLANQAFGLGGDATPFSVTLTIGVAEWHPGMGAAQLMETADRALYKGKAAGRNRVFAEV
jgi:diguanylate cyclase (GGDEF)-like protein/PAS domain S-box-containing protein